MPQFWPLEVDFRIAAIGAEFQHRGTRIALRLCKPEHFLLHEAKLVMSTDQQSMAKDAPPPAPRPTGAGAGGSVVYVIGLSSVAAVGGFLFGFDSGVINGAVGALAGAFG